MTDADLEAKFRGNAAIGGSLALADERIAALWGIEGLPDIGPLMRLMGG